MRRSFAVVPNALPRKTQGGPLSAAWTLYDPRKLAEKLGVSVEAADRALEETGFNKAVRIREEVIRWKERLRHEHTDLMAELDDLNKKRAAVRQRLGEVTEQLENTRNILRISRQKESE